MFALALALTLSPADAGPLADFAVRTQDRKEARALVGDWYDVRGGDRITVSWEDGTPAVTRVVATQHGEKMSVLASHYVEGMLTFSYLVPSTGWEVRWELMRPDPDELSVEAGWKSTYAGNEIQSGVDMLVWTQSLGS